MRNTPARNTLFYGDNLAILREHVKDESVDLVYLDPPFNSNANYNLLFKAPDGGPKSAVGLISCSNSAATHGR
jgi:16S rRNA G966 N2-methylase RsmD